VHFPCPARQAHPILTLVPSSPSVPLHACACPPFSAERPAHGPFRAATAPGHAGRHRAGSPSTRGSWPAVMFSSGLRLMPRPVPHRTGRRPEAELVYVLLIVVPPRAGAAVRTGRCGPGRASYDGGTIWCARRWDETGRVLNAASADELAEYLRRCGQPMSHTGRVCITDRIGQRLSDVPRPGSDASRSPGRGISRQPASCAKAAAARAAAGTRPTGSPSRCSTPPGPDGNRPGVP
jgi:hypothetical protein